MAATAALEREQSAPVTREEWRENKTIYSGCKMRFGSHC